MSTETSIAALQQQLASLDAIGSTPEVGAWRNETKGVLRGIFKVTHPSIEELQQIRFIGVTGLDQLDRGKAEAAGLLRGLIRELELSSAR